MVDFLKNIFFSNSNFEIRKNTLEKNVFYSINVFKSIVYLETLNVKIQKISDCSVKWVVSYT